MTKIFLDPGHGGSDPGAVGHSLREKDLVLDIALKTRRILENEYEGVQVRLSRTTDIFVSLSQRSKLARDWGADGFASIHLNAFTSTANGCETFMHNASSLAGLRNHLHAAILSELHKQGSVSDRGLKSANFAVLRGTYKEMKTALTESLFITNPNDAALLKQSGTIDAIARGHAIGFEKEFGLKKKNNASKPSSPSGVYVVKKGDTLTSIAKAHNTTVQALVNANKGIDPDKLFIGQKLNLSGSQAAPKPKPTPKPITGEWAIVQTSLNERYNTGLKVDNIPGPATKKAIIKGVQIELNRQTKAGLVVDGLYGAKTKAALITVRRGAEGNLTYLLQALLLLDGESPGSIDGIFGSGTEEAVKAYQRKRGLTVDGIAGRNTFDRLMR